jgi:hypothetical protein
MTSVQTRVRQNAPSHFMSISSLSGVVYAYNPNANTTTFSTAQWAWAPQSGNQAFLSTVTQPGALLKDLGKNVISSNRYFRKVQLVVRTGTVASGGVLASTFGVGGQATGTFPNADYLSGYIELGYEGGGVPAPVVQFGTL